jgi:hypothetical protein
VDEGRADQIWASIHAVARRDGGRLSVRHACIACVRALGAAGVGLSMARGPDGLREPVFATGPLSEELEELQFTLGEGPCIDAVRRDEPVLIDDLSAAADRRRWPMFAPAAAERGIRGMFAIPVLVGAARLGVLDVYWRTTGPLSIDVLSDALAYADAVLVLALDNRGGVTPELENSGQGGLIEWRAEVHQATGLVSVQLGIDVTEALVRLRAYAYLHDRRLADVAASVVARRLRFHPDGGRGEDPGENPGGGSGGDTGGSPGPHDNGGPSAAAAGIDKDGEA